MASDYGQTTSDLLQFAQKALASAQGQAARISGTNNASLRNPVPNVQVTIPALQAPPAFSDFFAGADNANPTIQWANGLVDEWVGKYFPTLNECLKSVPDEWLCEVIGGTKPLGYSQTYFELVWHSARDRAERTRRSEVATLDAEFSGRGFSLPPGAYVAAIDQASQRASDAVGEVNIQAAIKDEEVKLELLKFAEQQALTYKVGIMSSLADFYRQWILMPDKDIERAKIKAQATASLYQALGDYHQVEVAFQQLKLRAQELKLNVDIEVDRNTISRFNSINGANGALGAAVRGFSDVAGNVAGAAGTLSAQIATV